MTQNTISHSDHELPRFTWQSGALKNARKKRMRLAWSVWFVAALFVLFQFFLQLSSGEVINGLMKSFALTAFGGGILASSYYYIYVLLQTPAGMLMDRYGPRGILSAGALVVCLGSFIFSSASSVAMALLGRVLMGGGSAFAFVGCLNIISIWFPKRQFAFMAAVVETAGVIGAIIGNFWLAHFIEKTGWRNCMMIAGIIAAILSVFLYSIVRNSPRKKSSRVNVDHFSLRENFKPILCNSLVWVNGTYSGLMFGIVTVFIALWAIPFFETSRHIDLVNATLIACALYGGIAIGGPIIGWVDGRTHWRRCIMIFNAFCASLLLFIIIFDTQLSLSITALLLFLTGVCASSYVLTFAIANDLSSPENRATCIGFTNMLCVVFAPILQPFIGFLITHLSMPNHFEWAVSVVPVSLIVAGVIGFFLPQK